MNDTKLQGELLIAHDSQDFATLSTLYSTAAFQFEAANDIDAACFYWTHAFVFALDADLEETVQIVSQKLAFYGRL